MHEAGISVSNMISQIQSLENRINDLVAQRDLLHEKITPLKSSRQETEKLNHELEHKNIQR